MKININEVNNFATRKDFTNIISGGYARKK